MQVLLLTVYFVISSLMSSKLHAFEIDYERFDYAQKFNDAASS